MTRHAIAVTVMSLSFSTLLAVTGTAQQTVRPRSIPTESIPLNEVRIVSSSIDRFVMEYRPSYTRRTITSADGSPCLSIEFPQGVSSASPGSPDLRYRQFPLAFPNSNAGRATVLSLDYEDIAGVDLAPVPKFQNLKDSLASPVYAKDAGQYSQSVFLPGDMAQIQNPVQVRSILLGGLRVVPVQYSPASRTVRLCSRLLVEVQFASGETPRIDAGDKQLFRSAVLNGDVLASWPESVRSLAKVSLVSSVLSSGDWYRISISEEGIYRIDAQYLQSAGISLSNLDPRTIRIFGNGGREVPEDLTQSRASDLTENAIYVEGESDGSLGSSDYILFYGRPTRTWAYDSLSRTIRHTLNHYSEVNYYWLTFGGVRGKRMADRQSLTGTAGKVAEQFLDGVFVEDEKVNKLGSGKDWLGRGLDKLSSSTTYVNVLNGLASTGQIMYRYALVARDASYSPRFTVREGSTTLGTYIFSPVYQYLFASAGTYQATGTAALTSNTSQLSFTLSSAGEPEGWIDWIEILYPRMLWGVNGYLRFRSPDTTAVVEYRLQQFTVQPTIFDVTDPMNVSIVRGVTGSYGFLDSARAGSLREYCAAGSGAWKTPGSVQKIANQDLRGYTGGANFIILTSSEFRAAADRLKAFREQAAYGGLKTIVVDVGQIYNEFGGGLPDISAIRDYLKYAYDNWTLRPTFVLMFGGASYDYKGILGKKTSYVPTWQSAESRDDVHSYATDDFFAQFGQSAGISLVLGRISSRTLSEANLVVDKIIAYEQNSDRDPWKLRMLYIGDDAWTSDGGDSDGAIHSSDAETVANSYYTPEVFEKRKIYIAEYPTVYTSVGRRKPGAYQEILDQINDGALVVNYSGHGNTKVWAHESIFDVSTSIPQLKNHDRLAVFFLATCNFSQFDNPQEYTGGELLLNRSEGGAVGVISATRKVYQAGNAALNQGTFRALFSRDRFDRVVVERPATALYLYKAGGTNGDNDQKFFYMGDPTTHLQYPGVFAGIDSINGRSTDSAARSGVVQLKALSHVTISGTVRDQNNRIDSSYSGTLSLVVNDVTRQQTIVDFYPGFDWSYVATGGTIFRGENSIVNGKFRAAFIVPKDISYSDTSGRGRLLGYFWSSTADGAGFSDNVTIGGTDSTASADREGPQISVYLGSRSFRPGDIVNEQPTLIIDLKDSSGINTSTTGIGHRIEAWVNNSTQSKDLTAFYSSKLNDFREGAVEYPLTGLSNGRNTLRVRAWDSYNNSSAADTYFDVASSEALTLRDLYNFPNPFADATVFTARQNQTSPLDMEVRVFTVAGRLVQSLRTTTSGESQLHLAWDGRDRDGDLLANGVYLYKMIVGTMDGRFTSEALGKLAIMR